MKIHFGRYLAGGLKNCQKTLGFEVVPMRLEIATKRRNEENNCCNLELGTPLVLISSHPKVYKFIFFYIKTHNNIRVTSYSVFLFLT